MKTYIATRWGESNTTVVVRERHSAPSTLHSNREFNWQEQNPLVHVFFHSSTGFEWGYGESGPADLALSILADHLGEAADQIQTWARYGALVTHCQECGGEGFFYPEDVPGSAVTCPTCGGMGTGTVPESRAWKLHHDFKDSFIAGAPHTGFEITTNQIDRWLGSIDARAEAVLDIMAVPTHMVTDPSESIFDGPFGAESFE